MINIVTWNIQCGRGIDGQISLARIADVIMRFADADIICLQEVARFDPELDDGKGTDQVMQLASFFPDHKPVFGAALNRWQIADQQPGQFGNMMLSRLPVIQMFNHMLPRPLPEIRCLHMPRQALEVVIAGSDGPLRITTTHLEFHSAKQRLAQVRHLHNIQAESLAHRDYGKVAPSSGPYADIAFPVRSIICGDFNAIPDDDVYLAVLEQIGDQNSSYVDAWRLINPQSSHAPTCGVYDHNQWPEGPHCRDYFFLTAELSPLVSDVQVQEKTNASDHQPVLLTLNI